MAARQVGCTNQGQGKIFHRQFRAAVVNCYNAVAAEQKNGKLLGPLNAPKARVAGYFKIAPSTLSKILDTNFEIPTPGKTRNKAKTVTGDGVDSFTLEAIRRILYRAYQQGKVLTLADVLKEAQREEIGYRGGRESLRQLLKIQLGFTYAKNDNRRALCEKPEVVQLKSDFLKAYLKNLNNPNGLPVVFLDETWLFMHGAEIRGWVDKTQYTCKHTKGSTGRRFIVLHAGGRNGFIPGCSLLFASKTNSGDYHDEMNSENFTKWVTDQLIPNLSGPSLIVIDNAPYHSKLLESRPTTAWNKAKLVEWLNNKNIKIPSGKITKKDLLELARINTPQKRYVIDETLAAAGHKVLRLPPYHCEYNPIEMIWAYCKGYYNKNIGLNRRFGQEFVKEVWEEALSKVDAEMWSNNVRSCEQLMEKHYKAMYPDDDFNQMPVAPVVINLSEDDFIEDEVDLADIFDLPPSPNTMLASPIGNVSGSTNNVVPDSDLNVHQTVNAACSKEVSFINTSDNSFDVESDETNISPDVTCKRTSTPLPTNNVYPSYVNEPISPLIPSCASSVVHTPSPVFRKINKTTKCITNNMNSNINIKGPVSILKNNVKKINIQTESSQNYSNNSIVLSRPHPANNVKKCISGCNFSSKQNENKTGKKLVSLLKSNQTKLNTPSNSTATPINSNPLQALANVNNNIIKTSNSLSVNPVSIKKRNRSCHNSLINQTRDKSFNRKFFTQNLSIPWFGSNTTEINCDNISKFTHSSASQSQVCDLNFRMQHNNSSVLCASQPPQSNTNHKLQRLHPTINVRKLHTTPSNLNTVPSKRRKLEY